MPQKLSIPPKIIVILGPTASGKSELAIKIAKHLSGAEIISADSRQVYKGLNIGSGKVPNELANPSRILAKDSRDYISDSFAKQYIYKGIPHHLLDVASPKRVFTVSQYQKLAKRALKNIIKRGKIPIICGGTGLYIDSLIYDYQFPKVPPQPKLRKQLEKKSTEKLFQQLKKLDLRRAENIDKHNRRRLIRAIEICLTTGKPVPSPADVNANTKVTKVVGRPSNNFSKIKILKIGIKKTPEGLKKSIEKRIDRMIKLGLINETRQLVKKYPADSPAFDAIGYREIINYFQGKISLPGAIDLIKKNTRQYAKRQMTWFKRDKDIYWLTNPTAAIPLVRDFLKHRD